MLLAISRSGNGLMLRKQYFTKSVKESCQTFSEFFFENPMRFLYITLFGSIVHLFLSIKKSCQTFSISVRAQLFVSPSQTIICLFVHFSQKRRTIIWVFAPNNLHGKFLHNTEMALMGFPG